MLKKSLILILMILLVSGCAKSTPTAIPSATPLAAAAQGVFPTIPPATPTSSASPTPFTSFTVKPVVDTLKVRMNPGYMFDALRLVNKEDTLTVLGTAPGHEWVHIKTADGLEGWVFGLLLESSVDLNQIPVHEPKDVQVVKGRVTDANGTPIRGVTFAAGPGEQTSESGNVASSDSNGEFYFFIPGTESGTWNVTYTAIACESDVWSDSSCSTYKAAYTGNLDPATASVSLPQSSPLAFTWK